MCGRYFLEDNILDELEEKGYKISDQVKDISLKTIYPSQIGLYITGSSYEKEVKAARWGFPMKDSSKLIINARSETVTEKRIFQKSFEENRILIIMSSFFEWNRLKEKYTVKRKDNDIIYTGGLLRNFNGVDTYTMLTTLSNSSMKKIHHRMPLILEEDMIEDWIFDKEKAKKLLEKNPTEVKYTTAYQQLTLL